MREQSDTIQAGWEELILNCTAVGFAGYLFVKHVGFSLALNLFDLGQYYTWATVKMFEDQFRKERSEMVHNMDGAL